MKRLTALLFTFALLFSLVACSGDFTGNNTNSSETDNDTNSVQNDSTDNGQNNNKDDNKNEISFTEIVPLTMTNAQ